MTRDGGSPGGGCPSSGSPSTATSCTDTGVPIGTHEYTVTAVWRTWTATSTAKSATVAFGPATHLVLEAASVDAHRRRGRQPDDHRQGREQQHGRAPTPARTASSSKAPKNRPMATKPVVIDRSGTARSFGEATEITFTEGKATVASAKNGVMKLYKAETADIVVEEGSLSNGAGLAVTVKAAATKKLTLSAPSEATAGSAFSVTLTATDEYGNPTTSYTGEKTLAWSGPASSPGGHAPEYPASATTVTFTNGVGTASEIDLYDAVATVTLTVKEGSAVKGSASIAVKAAAAKTLVFTALAEQTAGTAFNATLTAHDEYGNTATGYAGAKTLLWSGPSSSPSAQAPSYPATVTFSEGAGTASITLYDAQGTALVAKEGTLEGTSDTFTVKAAAAKKFIVPAPSEQEAGVAFNVTLTATDTWGNIAKSYTGNKTITWSGPASSPSGQAPSYTTTITFTEGAGAASAIKLYDAQSTALLAKQSSSVEGTSKLHHGEGGGGRTPGLVAPRSERRLDQSRNLSLCLCHGEHRPQRDVQCVRQRHRRLGQHREQPRRRDQGQGRIDIRFRHAHQCRCSCDPRIGPGRILDDLRIHEPGIGHERSRFEAAGRIRDCLYGSRSAREVLVRSSPCSRPM